MTFSCRRNLKRSYASNPSIKLLDRNSITVIKITTIGTTVASSSSQSSIWDSTKASVNEIGKRSLDSLLQKPCIPTQPPDSLLSVILSRGSRSDIRPYRPVCGGRRWVTDRWQRPAMSPSIPRCSWTGLSALQASRSCLDIQIWSCAVICLAKSVRHTEKGRDRTRLFRSGYY